MTPRAYGRVQLVQVGEAIWESQADDLDHGREVMRFTGPDAHGEALRFVAFRYPHLDAVITLEDQIMEKRRDPPEPKSPRESSPKHSGYGTDTIGGKGEAVARAAVKELVAQGKEFHHMVEGGGGGRPENSSHTEHVAGRRMGMEGRGHG